MSLELALEKNTAALLSLQAMLAGLTLTASAAAPGPKSAPVADASVSGPATVTASAPTKTAKGTSPVAESVAAPAQASTVATPDPKSTAAIAATPKSDVTDAGAPVTYDDVKALVLQVSKDKGRDAAAAVLTGLGVAKAPELKPEQYAAAVAQLKAVLA
jgi:hypothetical protein